MKKVKTRLLPKLKNPKVDEWENGCGAYVGKNKILYTGIIRKYNKIKHEMIYVFLCVNGRRIHDSYWLPIKSRGKKDLIKAVEEARLKYKTDGAV